MLVKPGKTAFTLKFFPPVSFESEIAKLFNAALDEEYAALPIGLIVEEFDEKFALVQFVANEENLAQPVGQFRTFIVGRVINVDCGDAFDNFADTTGKQASG